MNRRLKSALVITAVVTSSVGGWLAGSRISSPAEVAARTSAPQASPILVPVEDRLLSSDVVTRGTGRFGSPQSLTVATSALKPNPGLVSDLPLAGAQLDEGAVALTASGRPVFVLVGAQPMSRDLGPGLSGQDVRQLEEALMRLGVDPGPVDGVYDEQTETGVSAWYTAAGFTGFSATVEQLVAVRARETDLATARAEAASASDSVASAQANLSSAQTTLDAARARANRAPGAAERARAEAAAADRVAAAEVTTRQVTLDALRSGPVVPSATPAEIATATAELNLAQANASAIRLAGARAVADAQAALNSAPATLAGAQAESAAANIAANADVAARQAALDAVIADGSSTPAQIATAQAELATARSSAETIRQNGARTVADAQAVQNGAQGALDAATATAAAANTTASAEVAAKQAALDAHLKPRQPTASEITAAERELSIAQANAEIVHLSGIRAVEDAESAAATIAAEVGAAQDGVGSAGRSVANAQLSVDARTTVADLALQAADLARRRAGVQVPADEIVFVESSPVRVSELKVGKGSQVLGAVMTVTDAQVSVDAGLAVADAALVQPGMIVEIDEPELGIATTGVVKRVADAPGTNGVDGFHIYFETQVEEPPARLVGASVRLTIAVESSGGTVLAVPVSAVTLAPDGSSRVQRSVDGVIEFVSVEPGLSADGYVAIVAVDGSLRAGDLVVIGFDGGGAPPGADTTPDTTTDTGSDTTPDTTSVTTPDTAIGASSDSTQGATGA